MANTTNKPRMTWKRQPSMGGLAAIGEGQMGSQITVDGEMIACTSYSDGKHDRTKGWQWWVSSSCFCIPWKNSASEGLPPVATEAEAKAAARAYIAAHFK